MRQPLLWPLLLSCTLAAAACEEARFEQVDIAYFRFPASSAAVVHELELSDLESAARWKVDRGSPITVGGREGEAAFQDLTDVVRLPDGRLAAADGFGARVLVFDSAGRLVDEWGRQGAGPGEFQHASWLGFCGADGLSVFDLPLSRLTVYSLSGDVIETVRVQPPGGRGLRQPPACDEMGNFALLGPRMLRQTERPVGPFRPFVTLSIRGAGDEEPHEVAKIRGADSYRWREQMGPLGDFGRRPSFAMADGSLFVTTGDAFEIAEYDADGDLLSLIVADDVERPPVTGGDLARVRREQLDAAPPDARSELDRTLTSMEWPRFHPVLQSLQVDSEGCLWVRHVRPRDRRALWRVLTRTGEPVGVVRLPKGFTLTQVTGRELVGHAPGPLDVDRVVVYRYDREAGSRC